MILSLIPRRRLDASHALPPRLYPTRIAEKSVALQVLRANGTHAPLSSTAARSARNGLDGMILRRRFIGEMAAPRPAIAELARRTLQASLTQTQGNLVGKAPNTPHGGLIAKPAAYGGFVALRDGIALSAEITSVACPTRSMKLYISPTLAARA